MPPKSKVELYAEIRCVARAGLSDRALQRKYGVGFRTAKTAAASVRLDRARSRAIHVTPHRQARRYGLGGVSKVAVTTTFETPPSSRASEAFIQGPTEGPALRSAGSARSRTAGRGG
ncbi:hypothetical protein CLM62_16555 [Streptomyces sp. SA15]|nr:hypothetical protein CLM62_16555 [Streptomyces sp. SA15]